ncbi:MAG: 3-hydroxyacyl-CoA dehydrogenase NAD-binding domain-containing protein [Rhodospirillaceae bacterium]|nr:3-hydroxyacyl-CoA dehydrogenase NAD-binding domain-containing protein [Rhodospirillaceae bacterium]
MEIRKLAVIGAGVMGSGIAAQVANAGVPVLLMDIVPEGTTNRNTLASSAIAKMLGQDPAPFMHKQNAKLVEPANLEDDLEKLGDCDWIVEAVTERLDIKRDVYRKIEAHRKTGAAVTSNTSTIPLARLLEGVEDGFAQNFFITHFFNPPRYMRLLEIVSSARTDPETVKAVRDFSDVMLGKTVIACNDTPGFIANRIGGYWIQTAIKQTIETGLSVEEADAVGGKPMGVPKTGIFGLMDLVGIDLMRHVAVSMVTNLPDDDPYVLDYQELPLVLKMVEEGYTGRKGKGGFYRINGVGKIRESIDLETGEYSRSEPSELESAQVGAKNMRALVEHEDRGGRWAWQVLSKVIAHSASLVPEIADTLADIDAGMRLGYAWKWGPFELADRLGPRYVADRLREEGRDVPPLLDEVGDGSFYKVQDGHLCFFGVDGSYHRVERPNGVLLLEDIKRTSAPIEKNGSASLWNIGDGVICFEIHTKMNAIDPDVTAMLEKGLKLVAKDDAYKALVVYNEGSNFSVGANVGMALFAANVGVWPMIETMIENGQQVMKSMKYADFPVVAAPSGMALGGGCELLLHSAAVQAHAETYTGLVETGIGVVPGWGGCKEMVTRHMLNTKRPAGPLPPIAKAFEYISTATVAKSAQEARDMLILRKSDGVTFNRDRLLHDAKQKALSMVDGYVRPAGMELNLPGPSGKAALDLAIEDFRLRGVALPHDTVVSGEVGNILTGGKTDITETVSEDKLYELERESFIKLLKTNATLARIEHMLDTGEPLRN